MFAQAINNASINDETNPALIKVGNCANTTPNNNNVNRLLDEFIFEIVFSLKQSNGSIILSSRYIQFNKKINNDGTVDVNVTLKDVADKLEAFVKDFVETNMADDKSILQQLQLFYTFVLISEKKDETKYDVIEEKFFTPEELLKQKNYHGLSSDNRIIYKFSVLETIDVES